MLSTMDVEQALALSSQGKSVHFARLEVCLNCLGEARSSHCQRISRGRTRSEGRAPLIRLDIAFQREERESAWLDEGEQGRATITAAAKRREERERTSEQRREE